MTTLTLTSTPPARIAADALVVVVASSPDGPRVIGGDSLPSGTLKPVMAAARTIGLTGAVDEISKLPVAGIKAPVVVLAGVGASADDAEAVRRAIGGAVRELAGAATVAIALPTDTLATVTAAAEGALLGAYSYLRYRAAGDAPVGEVVISTSLARGKEAKAIVTRATVLAAAVHGTRDLVNAAPNDLYPAAFAEIATTVVKDAGIRTLKVSVLDDKALVKGGYGGIVGVGQGSLRPPRLVQVSYAPSRPVATVALVGKGITFDSGGISIKPAAQMDEMKSDMAGAAAVLHTVVAAAKLGLPVAVTGWLCLAENMPSGSAQRPSDVVTMRSGMTVEVLNTDAEGRLVMADGLAAAVEEKPDVVIDVATLTGAQIVALGHRVAAVMGNDSIREEIVAAAGAAGEAVWPMPLPAELRAGLNSKVADIANIGERPGGMLSAGLFLQEFVGTTPWAHVDIAGPAFNVKPGYGYTPAGGTGMAVRTLLTLIEQRAAARR